MIKKGQFELKEATNSPSKLEFLFRVERDLVFLFCSDSKYFRPKGELHINQSIYASSI